jgi:long-chain fatty acid transport protein
MRHFTALATLASGIALAATALADGGYYSGTLGARAAGRGGAFTARADDLTAVSHNPAGLANLDGTQVELGNILSYNGYSYTRQPTLDYGNPQGGVAPLVTFDQVSNGKPWQAVDPMLAVASHLGRKDWVFALAAYAPPGVALETFPANGGQRYMMLDREAMFLKYAASVAWKVHDVFGVGASAEWIHVPQLKYSLIIDGSQFNGEANPVSSDLDILVKMQGSSLFTFNATLGAWYRPVPSWMFAVSGQVVPSNIVLDSTLSLSMVDQSLPYEPPYLSRDDGTPANDASVTLPLPLAGRAGARYIHMSGGRERFDVELDVEYVTWSRVDRITVDTHGKVANYAAQRVPIDRLYIEKNWRDTVAVRLGGDFAALPGRLVLRAGAYYETAVGDPAYANVDFSTGAQVGGALGASLFVSPFEIALAYMLRVQPGFSVSEANARLYQQAPASACPADPDACNPNLDGHLPVVNAGTYSASSHFLSLNVRYRFGL